MSRPMEQVRFVIPARFISKTHKDSDSYRKLIEKVFGECLGRCEWTQDVTIICRLEQFARFIILRNEMGLPNLFMDFNPKIFEVLEPKKDLIFDVTGFYGR